MNVSSRALLRRLGIALTALLGVVLASPILVTAFGAFSRAEWYGQRSEGAAVESAAGVFRYVLEIWGNTLGMSLLVVAIVVPLALLIGAPAAYAFRRRPFPGSRTLESLALLPLSVPGIALAVALLVAAGSQPRLSLLVAGHLAYTIPLVLKTVGNALDTFDPAVEDAAATLGAGRMETAQRVILPLLGPALVLSALLVFAVSWGEFNVSFLLATPVVQTFPAALYVTYTNNSFPVAAAATILFLAPVVPALILIQALGGDEFRRGLSV